MSPHTVRQKRRTATRPLLDLRALVVLVLGLLAGWLAYGAGGWPAGIAAAVSVIGVLFLVLPH